MNGADQLVVDQMDSTTHNPWNTFLRFDVDTAHRTIESVQLRLTATDSSKAPAPASGDVWSVSPFDLDTLSVATPTQLALLAPDRGPVTQLQIVEWTLPVSTVSQPGPVFLGVLPTASDGANYWNLLGQDPPRLILR